MKPGAGSLAGGGGEGGVRIRAGQAAEVKAKGMSGARPVHTAGCLCLLLGLCCRSMSREHLRPVPSLLGIRALGGIHEPRPSLEAAGGQNLYLYTKKQI